MHSFLQNILRRVCMMILLMGLTTVSVLADNTFNQNRTDFRDESIYFMITTRFYDGDPNNNVLCWDNQQAQISTGDPCWRGDFAGVIEKLDYIKALGFTAIWITPIVQNASGYDYHGYHAMDFSKVDVRYESHKGKGKYGGSTQDVTFQSLIDAAHAKGIKIILDIVLNHTGNFGEQKLCHLFDRSQNILNQADINKCMLPDYSKLPSDYLDIVGAQQYQNRLKWMKNTDGQNHDTKNYWHHVANNWNWDLPNRWWGQIAGDCVDLNTENPEVDDYLIKCYGEFIKMGVDGFRIDTTGHISRLTFNSKFIPEFKALGEQYKSKRLNQAPFYMYGECCARFGGVTYRDQPNLSSYFYTWSSSSSDIKAWNSVSAQDWANVVVKEGADPLLNMTACEAEPSDQPESDNTFMKNGAYHEPDYSRSSGFNVIDFPLHYNFTSAASAYGLACGGDKYYNDASFNVVYVDSHDYGPQPNDGVRFSGSDAQWAENLSLMFTFRGIPCLYYGSEIGFKRGAKIDNGPNGPLSDTGRAYFGGYITGDVTASDFGTYTASGNVAATLNHDLAQHLIRLNKIRQAVPALRKGQWTSDGCQANGGIAFKRAYKDSYALVALNGGATFTGCPSGTYTDLVTGQTYSGSTITVSAPTNQGQVRVLVKDYSGKSGSALLGGDGKFIYASSSASKSGASYDGNQEAGTTSYITKEDATGEAGVYFSQNGGAFTTETLTVTAYLNDCTSGSFSINGGTAKSISSTGTSFTLGQGDEAGTEYTVTWTATGNDGSQKSGSVTFKKVGTYTPSCTADEVCVFYETTAAAVGIWVWNDKVNFTGGVWASKPNMEFMGLSASGKNIFKWTYTGSETSAPTKVIFLPGGTQSADLAYTNHGYYIDNVYDHTVESGAATPSFSVDKESQAFNNSISVTITPKNGATVVYTTDGTTPTTRSTTLATNKTLNFTATTTLKVGILIDGGVTDVKTYTYTYQEAPTGITIYVKASSAPNLYAWDSNEKALNGTWPGTKMTQTTTVSGETYYYQTFSAESVNIIFNNGSGSQTADIKNITADTYFTYNGTSGYEKVNPDTPEPPVSDAYTYTITYSNPDNWSSVDCYVWDKGNGDKQYLGSWPGKAMTKSGNNWTISFTTDKQLVNGMVIFNNGSDGTGNQTSDLTLSKYSKISVPTGISAASVNRPSQTIVVYTINGERAATVADLKEAEHILRSGIYVVNGRKFIIK